MSRSEIEHLPPSVQLAWLSTASAATYNQGPSPLTCECPFARADRCDGSGLGDEPAPGVAGGLDDLLVGVEDAVREPSLAPADYAVYPRTGGLVSYGTLARSTAVQHTTSISSLEECNRPIFRLSSPPSLT